MHDQYYKFDSMYYFYGNDNLRNFGVKTATLILQMEDKR